MSAARSRTARPGTSADLAGRVTGPRALLIADSSSLQIKEGYAKLVPMPTDPPSPKPPADEAGQDTGQDTGQDIGQDTDQNQTAKRPLTEAARRALDEAAARRAERDAAKPHSSDELSGRGGLDPTRYGDWEVNGLASDF
jgi:hypothetical protein